VILVIRFIGVLNAAIWLGAAVFFTFAVAPAFFIGDVEKLGLHVFWRGAMAQLILARYFQVQYLCGLVAGAHLLTEWIYLGRRLERVTLWLLITLMAVGLAGGVWIQPKLKRLNLVRYNMSETYKPAAFPAPARAAAEESFRFWHRVSQIMNLAAMGALGFYFWRVVHPPDDLRFVGATSKFRS
jgi:hypothetical protein